MSGLYKNNDGLMVNMYDCTACPKCGSVYRYARYRKGRPAQADCHCDDCGHVELWCRSNGKPEYALGGW